MFEIERNPNLTRQEYALEVLTKAAGFVVLEPEVEKRARASKGLKTKVVSPIELIGELERW